MLKKKNLYFFCTFDRPSVEAVCVPGLYILHCILMSHTAIEKEKSNKKTAKIYIVEGKNKDMFVKL